MSFRKNGLNVCPKCRKSAGRSHAYSPDCRESRGDANNFTTEGEVVVQVEIQEESETEAVLHFAAKDTGAARDSGVATVRPQSFPSLVKQTENHHSIVGGDEYLTAGNHRRDIFIVGKRIAAVGLIAIVKLVG